MKEIIVKRINVISVMKPLFLIAGVMGVVIGVGISLFIVPTSSTITNSVDGLNIKTIATPLAEVIGTAGSVIIGTIIICLVIAITIVISIMLFNLFCRITGGIKIDIEE